MDGSFSDLETSTERRDKSGRVRRTFARSTCAAERSTHLRSSPSDVSGKPTMSRIENRSKIVDLMLAVAAVLISAVSLHVAIVANQVQEHILAASTWPSLQFGTSNLDEQLEPEVRLVLENAGVGPARLRSVVVHYKGEPIGNQRELLERCCMATGDKSPTTTITSSAGAVLKAGSMVNLLRLRKADNPESVWTALNVERQHISLIACYCSVLENCWQFDSTRSVDEAQPVDTCPVVSADQNWSG
jgi:hypothetical protein